MIPLFKFFMGGGFIAAKSTLIIDLKPKKITASFSKI
jgi:hypothetical protein